MSQTSLHHARLDWNEAGTPVSSEFGDVYFSNDNGLSETRYVFLQQNRLPERFSHHDSDSFVIGETGFGTGLNFLATMAAFLEQAPCPATDPGCTSSASRNTPYPGRSAQGPGRLARACPLSQPHRPVAAAGLRLPSPALCRWPHPPRSLVWRHQGDAAPGAPSGNRSGGRLVSGRFLPAKNPEMWTQDLFDDLARLARPDATLSTFTCAGFVRRG